MNYFDLHCDTAFELYHKKAELYSNNLGVSVEKYQGYDKKGQIFAIWCDENSTDDECYLDFQHIAGEFHTQTQNCSEFADLCTDVNKLCEDNGRLKAVLAVEDARLLGGDLSRIERLYEFGVRFLTLGWKGTTNVCGAYDTEEGLTPFGFEVLKECENTGITIDVSHLSQKSFWDVAGKATKPFCATHSNSVMLNPHPRNLTDTQFRTIAASGGVVGVSFVGKHLSAKLAEQDVDENTTYENVIAHIEHFLAIDPKAVCIGSDFDGTRALAGLEDASQVTSLKRALSNRGADESTVDDVFYNNAYKFVKKCLENSQAVNV